MKIYLILKTSVLFIHVASSLGVVTLADSSHNVQKAPIITVPAESSSSEQSIEAIVDGVIQSHGQAKNARRKLRVAAIHDAKMRSFMVKAEPGHWSKRSAERQDPYAPAHPGAETVDDWCNLPKNFDPACKANPAAVSLQEEIDGVMKHLMCQLRPKTCSAPPAEEAKSEEAKENKPPPPAMRKQAEAMQDQHGDESWTLDKFRKGVEETHGNSDESFKEFDKDKNGEVSSEEFQSECKVVGVEENKDCEHIFSQMADEETHVASEEDYKEEQGWKDTSCRRHQHQHCECRGSLEAFQIAYKKESRHGLWTSQPSSCKNRNHRSF
jgi:hypothetical protein